MEEEEDEEHVASREEAEPPHTAAIGNGSSSGAAGSHGQEEPELPKEGHDEEQDCGIEGEEEEDADDDDLPSFEFRFETAKLLIELDDSTHAAVEVCTASVY